jgi:hypothetical protein
MEFGIQLIVADSPRLTFRIQFGSNEFTHVIRKVGYLLFFFFIQRAQSTNLLIARKALYFPSMTRSMLWTLDTHLLSFPTLLPLPKPNIFTTIWLALVSIHKPQSSNS